MDGKGFKNAFQCTPDVNGLNLWNWFYVQKVCHQRDAI